jgi:hypothetical protein
MPSRVAVGITLTVLAGALAISTAALKVGSNRAAGQVEDSQLQVITHQLPSVDGKIPVELRCGAVHPPKRPELLVMSCTIKNNTGKSISAFSIDYAIFFERWGGGEFPDAGLMTLNARIHPDFRQSHARELIPPGDERIIDRGGPIQHEDASAKRIEAKIDYVEFEDDTTLGPNAKGSNLQIASIREGAAKYKEWLKQKYQESGKSIKAVVPLLQDSSSLPTELGVNDPMLILGAEAYQKKARDVYRNGGDAEIEKLLDK